LNQTDPALAFWVFVFMPEKSEESGDKEQISAAQLKWLEQWNPPEEWMQ
jgi:hypothetical protein